MARILHLTALDWVVGAYQDYARNHTSHRCRHELQYAGSFKRKGNTSRR